MFRSLRQSQKEKMNKQTKPRGFFYNHACAKEKEQSFFVLGSDIKVTY